MNEELREKVAGRIFLYLALPPALAILAKAPDTRSKGNTRMEKASKNQDPQKAQEKTSTRRSHRFPIPLVSLVSWWSSLAGAWGRVASEWYSIIP